MFGSEVDSRFFITNPVLVMRILFMKVGLLESRAR